MARVEIAQADVAMPALPETPQAERLFELGMASSTLDGTDLVTAHKWFNLAALFGNQEALRYRQEIAREMSQDEIAQAQRDAREWLRAH
jgi:hypothetical protein